MLIRLFVYVIAALSCCSAAAQSSWYNPHKQSQQMQQTQPQRQNSQPVSSWYNPGSSSSASSNQNQSNAPALSYDEYATTFSNGAVFNGFAEKKYGTLSMYKGTIRYTNGDWVSGYWDPSWRPISNHDYYRASDNTSWTRIYDNYGNFQREYQRHYVPGAPQQNTHQSGTPSTPSHSNSGSSRWAQCQGCGGSGDCPRCHGTGYADNGYTTCSLCGGQKRCKSCGGTGGFHH